MGAAQTMEVASSSLVDLLGRRWTVTGHVGQLAFNASNTLVAFALRNGRLAIAPVADAESSIGRFHIEGDSGRATLRSRTSDVPPIEEIAIDDGDLHVSAFGPERFIAGGVSGRLAIVSTSGRATPFKLAECGAVRGIAALREKAALVAFDSMLKFYDATSGTARTSVPLTCRPTALASSSDGRWIALSDKTGITIRSAEIDLPISGRSDRIQSALAFSWSPDGKWLAASSAHADIAVFKIDEGQISHIAHFPSYPGPVISMDWDTSSTILATSGAFRVVLWPIDQIENKQANPRSLPTGRSGLVLVEAVNILPGRDLVATSFANGMVVIAQMGTQEELLIRPPGPGVVRVLHWSKDGTNLAYGTDDGEVAIVTLPPRMFKSGTLS